MIFETKSLYNQNHRVYFKVKDYIIIIRKFLLFKVNYFHIGTHIQLNINLIIKKANINSYDRLI